MYPKFMHRLYDIEQLDRLKKKRERTGGKGSVGQIERDREGGEREREREILLPFTPLPPPHTYSSENLG